MRRPTARHYVESLNWSSPSNCSSQSSGNSVEDEAERWRAASADDFPEQTSPMTDTKSPFVLYVHKAYEEKRR
ncbi:hypothetical protein STEG23_023453 [Scotinomys teguina]